MQFEGLGGTDNAESEDGYLGGKAILKPKCTLTVSSNCLSSSILPLYSQWRLKPQILQLLAPKISFLLEKFASELSKAEKSSSSGQCVRIESLRLVNTV
jgi:hypothetical protein